MNTLDNLIMLWVYAGLNLLECIKHAKEDLPKHAVDLSKVNTEHLPKAIQDFCNHHETGHIFLGFLDPLLMLHPTEETLLRRGFTQCDMSVIVSNPCLLPLSWKNGCEKLRIYEAVNAPNTETLHDGGSPHIQDESGYGRIVTQTPNQRDTYQSGKKRRSTKRGKQEGPD
jgi:hypothetical protein